VTDRSNANGELVEMLDAANERIHELAEALRAARFAILRLDTSYGIDIAADALKAIGKALHEHVTMAGTVLTDADIQAMADECETPDFGARVIAKLKGPSL
jgi:hypothetical protein